MLYISQQGSASDESSVASSESSEEVSHHDYHVNSFNFMDTDNLQDFSNEESLDESG